MIDERERLPHRECAAIGVEHLGVARVDRHARTDGRLREIDGRDVAALEVGECGREFGLEGVDERAACGGGRGSGLLATDEDDGGGEGVGADANGTRLPFGAHWPCAADREACFDHSFKERVPTCVRRPVVVVTLGLLERVVDRDGEC